MIRSVLAMIVSLLFPGVGHAAVNFDFVKGFAIMIIYFMLISAVASSGNASMIGIIPLYHILAGVSAYRG